MSEKHVGKVIWFDARKGFGFIELKGSDDIFLHFSDIQSEPGQFKTVKKDDTVSFSMGINNRNEPKAIDVIVIPK